VRISPFDSAARRQTSFAAVDVTPEVDDDIVIDIKEADVRIDTYRSSGAGGQKVNKTDSAVRLTHIPTGIVVAVQNERSQQKNRGVAWKILRSRLYEHEERKRQAVLDAAEAQKKDIDFGSQIRSYVLQPYRMVKDLRTGVETGKVDDVLDGEIEGFIQPYLLGVRRTDRARRRLGWPPPAGRNAPPQQAAGLWMRSSSARRSRRRRWAGAPGRSARWRRRPSPEGP